MLRSLLKGIDSSSRAVFGGQRDSRKVYVSAVDRSLQPYRLYVPSAYGNGAACPLVVALRGMGDDENAFFDKYSGGQLKADAEKRGMFVVCPRGRGQSSMYRGEAAQDVLDVMAEVKREYRIDGRRVYLMGHSMGAYGTWSIAMANPHLFAGLGPIAGGGDPKGLEKIRRIPQYIVHGAKDRLVPVRQSRMMVEAAKRLGVPHVYVEYPNGDHQDVVAPSFGPMLDYFAAI